MYQYYSTVNLLPNNFLQKFSRLSIISDQENYEEFIVGFFFVVVTVALIFLKQSDSDQIWCTKEQEQLNTTSAIFKPKDPTSQHICVRNLIASDRSVGILKEFKDEDLVMATETDQSALHQFTAYLKQNTPQMILEMNPESKVLLRLELDFKKHQLRM